MKYSKYQGFNRQLGISLVEVMVALVISLFLLTGIVQVYLANKTSYSFTNAISRIQENGRYAMDTMAQDLRMSGYFGCAVFDRGNQATFEAIVNNLDTSGTGYNGELMDFLGQPLVEGTEGDGLNGSDSITLRGAAPGNASIEEPFMPNKSGQVFITQPNDIVANDIVLITNCRGADIFQVTNANDGSGVNADKTVLVHNTGVGEPGNYNPDTCVSGHCLSQTYGADATMFKLRAVIYTIKAGENVNEPALWRQEYDADGTTIDDQELVEGIEQMQVLYGVDTSGDDHPNQYMTADLISEDFTQPINWDMVMSIRLMLLVRSEAANVVEAPQMVDYNGVTGAAADNRLRQVFTTTIALRNRVSDT